MGRHPRNQIIKSKFLVKRFIDCDQAFLIVIVRGDLLRKDLCKRLLGAKMLSRNLNKIDRRELI